MALYNQLLVYKTAQNLLVEVVRASHTAGREFRYTLFQDMRNTLTQLLLQIYRINRTRDKQQPLQRARELAVETGIYLHLLAELKGISARQYAVLLDLQDSTSKQLAAWEKAITQASPPG